MNVFTPPYRWLSGLLLALLLWLLLAGSALAGVMNRDELARRYPAPYIIGEKDTAIPVWPIFEPNFQQKASENLLVGYVFESIDLAPVPGFSCRWTKSWPILAAPIRPKGRRLVSISFWQNEFDFLE